MTSTDTAAVQITRTTTLTVPVREGDRALSVAVDRACGEIERVGNRVVSISHAAHEEGFRSDRIWTVLIAYTKGSA